MMNPSYLLILITLWFLLELALPEEEICPLPTNIKIHLYPGLVSVTWDCNITKSMEKFKYKIHLQNSIIHTLNVFACSLDHDITDDLAFTIHDGLYAFISTYNSKCSIKVIATKEDTIPEGKQNSAAENFSCLVYNVSIVDCSWTAGREAPKDTQYSLAFRLGDEYIECEDYRTDSFGRQVGCVWKSPNINFSLDYYVQLVGSSNETSIRFFDTFLKLNDYVILDPPRNIRLNYSSNELEITWEQPETYSDASDHLFLYDISINGEIKRDLKGNSYKTHKLHNERVNVSMRAKWDSSCSKYTQCSRWSEAIIYDSKSGSAGLTPHHLLMVLGVVTAALFFILIFLCHRFRIWKKLFPKVPQPTLKFLEQKEFSEQNMMANLPKKVDDEECICSPVAELSQKDQLEITA